MSLVPIEDHHLFFQAVLGVLKPSSAARVVNGSEVRQWVEQVWRVVPSWGWAAVVAVGAIGIGVVLAQRGRLDLPYVAARSLLTPAERAFFAVLQRAVGGQFQLFAKVRVGDVLQVRAGVEGKRRLAAFGRISSKHADFVACDLKTFAVVGVIELDDRSHEREDRRRRDEFFDAAMEAAGVPVLRVKVQRAYDAQELREAVREAFGEG